jgi:membrane protein
MLVKEPELSEPKVDDPGLRDLTFADWKAIGFRAVKEFLNDNCMMLASALAYAAFFAIPSLLIVLVGVFTLVASPETITSLMDHFRSFMPADATKLLGDSLRRAQNNSGASLAVTVIGFVIALWAVTSCMNSYMTALTMIYERKDRRSFLRKRIVALKMAGVLGVAVAIVTPVTILGPVVESAIASRIGAAGDVLDVVWWVLQLPILLGLLLAAFAILLYLGPDVEPPKWEFLTPGSFVAALLWLASSALFAVYTSMFDSYNKAWGTLSGVIVTLTWLWIAGMALLIGAEINREAELSRELRARSS